MLKGILVNYSIVTGKSHEAIQNAYYTNEMIKGSSLPRNILMNADSVRLS